MKRKRAVRRAEEREGKREERLGEGKRKRDREKRKRKRKREGRKGR